MEPAEPASKDSTAEFDDEQMTALEELVNELMKTAPEERLVQSYIKEAGLKDPGDQVSRIQLVLKTLQFKTPRTEFEE